MSFSPLQTLKNTHKEFIVCDEYKKMIIELEKKVKNIVEKKRIDETFKALDRTMNVKFEEFGKRIKDLESSLKQKDLIISDMKQKIVNIQKK